MGGGRHFVVPLLLALVCALSVAPFAQATGVPVSGFLPLVGIGLSNEFDHDDFFPYYAAYNTSQPTSSMMLGNGSPHFDVALLDSGAGFSALTSQAYEDFNVDGPYSGNPDGFAGTNQMPVGGATGNITVDVNEPLGLYVAGLQSGTGGASLTMNLNAMTGQTNTSMVTFPGGSDLPNVVGLTFASRYATFIRNDQPQILQLNGKTVRAPAVEFHPLGSGNTLGITRRAFLDPAPAASFGDAATPVYLGFGDGNESWADPIYPTLLQSGGGTYLTVNAKENNTPLGNSQFLFDTGADVTVVSAFSANQLGYSGTPDFTVAVVGSGGTFFDVPGFFLDELTVFAENSTNHANSNLVLQQVPVIILDVTNPNGGGIVPGIIGTNVLAGRNAVLDPRPVGGGISPGLYISDPVTAQKNWTSTAASGNFATGSNWSGGSVPDLASRSVANVRYVSGGNQTAVVAANATVWEVNVSGTASQTMTLQVQNGVTLQTFSGINIEQGGAINLQNSTLDAQYLEVFGGTLSGAGTVTTGSGPIPGQVENRGGTVAPGNGIGQLTFNGRFASGPAAKLSIELGGTSAGPQPQYDQLTVIGSVALAGTLSVSLADLGGGTFAPSVGNSFTILTATGDVAGTFDNLLLPAGYLWNVAYGSNNVVLSVTGIGLAGDFNGDHKVDAADYVQWRKTNGSAQDYATWRSHFGTTAGSGSADGFGANVPEPAGLALTALAACVVALRHRSLVGPFCFHRR